MKLATDNATARTTEIPANIKPGGAHETNYHQRMANHCREEYARTYTLREALVTAHLSGFIDVTIRTANGSITIPFIGGDKNEQRAQGLYVELAEMLGDKLGKLEHDILDYEKDSEKDEADEREGAGTRAETFAFCLPMRPLSDAEFEALPAEARRAYDEHRAEQVKAA
ncbi:MAG: hypothetical protein ACRYFZ_07320 [Janthinobacterium lividum]